MKNIEAIRKKKLIFLTFHGIHKGIARGMTRVHLPIVNSLSQDKRFDIQYFLGNYKKEKNNQIVLHRFSVIFRLFARANSIISKYILLSNNIDSRLRNEKAFDFLASIKFKRSTALITSALLLNANSGGGLNRGKRIFIAGNPHDKDLWRILREEELKAEIKLNDTYLHQKRLTFVTESISSFDTIVCFSEVVYNSFKRYISEDKLKYFPKHLLPDFDLFPEQNIVKSSRLTFCFIAHPTWLKGLPYLLEAWQQAGLTNADLKIGGALNGNLKALIQEKFSHLKNVTYLGNIPSARLNEFYRSAHVSIVPSLMDAGPTTVVESMYCGLPCIVSKGCGAHTLVEDMKSGIVVNPCDVNEIVVAMKWFYQNSNIIDVLGQNARYAVQAVVEKDIELNKELGRVLARLV